jgi:hypothetical protein
VPGVVEKGRLFLPAPIYSFSCSLGRSGGFWVKAGVEVGRVERLKRIYPDIPWVPQIITLYLGNPDNNKNQYSLVVSGNLGVYNVLKMFWVPQCNPGTTRTNTL